MTRYPSSLSSALSTEAASLEALSQKMASLAASISSSSSLSSKRIRTKKSVSFPTLPEQLQIVEEVPSRQDLTEDDKKNLWFARSDYQFSRSTARVISKESERYGYSKNLDAVYNTHYCEPTQQRLNMWALHGHSRRGLERWANSPHGKARKDDQCMYLQALQKTQIELQKSNYPNAAERLREIGHLLSRKSRLFAQMMGAADEYAAQQEDAPHTIGSCMAASTLTPAQPLLMPIRKLSPRRNLGLSSSPKVNCIADLKASAPRAPMVSPSAKSKSPKFQIKPKERVPRVA
jgi:hypothetical protein